MVINNGTNTNSGMRLAVDCEIERLKERNAKLEVENARFQRVANRRGEELRHCILDRDRLKHENESLDNLAKGSISRVQVLEREKAELVDLLGKIFDKYENGDPCYEDPDNYEGYTGNAVRLDDVTLDKIVAALAEGGE